MARESSIGTGAIPYKIVILSAAKDLLFHGSGTKQVLRCAQDDKN